MGGVDKGWVSLSNQPLILHTLFRLTPQVKTILISANRELDRYQSLGYPVISDNNRENGFQGPVAGILAALNAIKTDYAVIVPVDAPLLSKTLVQTLLEALENRDKLILINDGERTHPLFGLYHRSLLESLENYFRSGNRRLMQWCMQQSPKIINAPHLKTSFANVNDPTNLITTEKVLTYNITDDQ